MVLNIFCSLVSDTIRSNTHTITHRSNAIRLTPDDTHAESYNTHINLILCLCSAQSNQKQRPKLIHRREYCMLYIFNMAVYLVVSAILTALVQVLPLLFSPNALSSIKPCQFFNTQNFNDLCIKRIDLFERIQDEAHFMSIVMPIQFESCRKAKRIECCFMHVWLREVFFFIDQLTIQ